MADQRENKSSARSASAEKPASPPMGAALRTVYQRAVEEAIPDEMLDLLAKLD